MFLASTPSSRPVFANVLPRNRRYIIRAIPPPPTASFHSHLTRRTWNPATAAPFRVFDPQPPPPPCVCECTAPQLPLHCTSHPTIFSYCPPLLFYAVHPKPSRRARFCGFQPPAPSPAS